MQDVAPPAEDDEEDISDPRLWKKDGWIVRVIKNEDDEGWAVEMTRKGDAEPALVTPWTMGRDKKNPKPLDHGAFATLVKTTNDVLARHQHALRAKLHRSFSYATDEGQRIRIDLDIAQDDDDPHAILAAFDERTDELIRTGRTMPNFKLTATTAARFVRTGEA
ncbi:MAG: hypothetical protein NT062_00450 [Proteobacteria bacterium]|nr:hypothetical protein [Pseudomonadota bacterium]